MRAPSLLNTKPPRITPSIHCQPADQAPKEEALHKLIATRVRTEKSIDDCSFRRVRDPQTNHPEPGMNHAILIA